jgi:hypothetical protein
MKALKSQINLRITNNTSFNQFVDILSVIPNPLSANESNGLYNFDMSSVNFLALSSFTITYTSTSNPTPVTISLSVSTQNIQGFVDALNTLGIGIFNFSGTTIYVSSSIYVYSNITIGGSSILGVTGTDPSGIVLDSLGNVYTCNSGSDNITKITPSGVSSIFASTGGVDCRGITIDSSDNLYVCNYVTNNVSKITPSGVSSIFASTGSNPIAIKCKFK